MTAVKYAAAVAGLCGECQIHVGFAVGPISALDEAQRTGGSQEGLPLASRHTCHDLITGIAAGHKPELRRAYMTLLDRALHSKYEQPPAA